MARGSARFRDRNRIQISHRVRKHIARLSMTPAGYVEWCRRRGFALTCQKSWEDLEREWSVHCRELEEARARERLARDPRKLLAEIATGARPAADVARPRLRALAQAIETERLDGDARRELARLIELVNARGTLLLEEARFGGTPYPLLCGLASLARCRADWIRPPDEWRERSHSARRQFSSLARHLLARYPVPRFLDAAWLRRDADAARYRDWFLRLGSGVSLRTAEAPIPLTKRIVHHFLQAPADYGIEHALRWGQVHALGGDVRIAEAVLGTRLGLGFDHDDFWISVVRFLIEHPEFPVRRVNPLVDYLHYQRFDPPDAPLQPNLSMRGRSVRSLQRQISAWHRQLRAIRVVPSSIARVWPASGVRGLRLSFGMPWNRRTWHIRELLTFKELEREGKVMRHCVASYVTRCASGHSSIWTLELEDATGVTKHQTVELQGRVIVQCRGKRNSPPQEHELKVLRHWAQQEHLAISVFVGA